MKNKQTIKKSPTSKQQPKKTTLVNKNLNQTQKRVKIKTSDKKFSGIIDNIGSMFDAGVSVADTIITTMENPVDGLLNKLPNSIAKIADMANTISKPLVPNSNEEKKPVITGPILKESKEEKFITRLKKDIPVVNITQMPSSYSPDYSPAPLTIKDSMFGNTPCVRINGSVIMEGVQAPDNTGTLHRLRTGFLNPGTTNVGSILRTMTGQYQKHLWLNAALFYIPQCPTTVQGNIMLSWQNSPNNAYTPTTFLTELSQRSSFAQGHVNKGLTLPLKGDHKQLYNWFSTYTSDMKFYSDWSYEWWCIGLNNSVGQVGYIGLTFDVLLFSRIENPVIGLMNTPRQISHYISCNSGFSDEKTMSILERLFEKLEGIDQTSVCQKALVRGTYTLDSLKVRDLIIQIMDWSGKIQHGNAYCRFLDSFQDVIQMRSNDLILMSHFNLYSTNKFIDLLSTFLAYIVNYSQDDSDDDLFESSDRITLE